LDNSNSNIGLRSIHVVGEATALLLCSTPTGSFIFREDRQRLKSLFFSPQLVLSAASEAIASPTAKINQIRFRSIHVVGEGTHFCFAQHQRALLFFANTGKE